MLTELVVLNTPPVKVIFTPPTPEPLEVVTLPSSTPAVDRRKFCVSCDPLVTVAVAVAESHPGLLADNL